MKVVNVDNLVRNCEIVWSSIGRKQQEQQVQLQQKQHSDTDTITAGTPILCYTHHMLHHELPNLYQACQTFSNIHYIFWYKLPRTGELQLSLCSFSLIWHIHVTHTDTQEEQILKQSILTMPLQDFFVVISLTEINHCVSFGYMPLSVTLNKGKRPQRTVLNRWAWY